MNRGFITMAFGFHAYLEMAVDLALSLAETNREPLSIVVDAPRARALDRRYRALFDQVIPLPDGYPTDTGAKYCLAEVTPYARTMFLDADMFVLGDLGRFWDAVSGHGFAMIGEYLGPEDDVLHNGYSSASLLRDFGLQRYFKNASAMFYFEREAGRAVMREALAVYQGSLQSYVGPPGACLGDEVGFALVGDRLGFSRFPEPGPIMWQEDLAAFSPPRIEKPVHHFMGRARPDVLAWLLDEVRRRRRAAGLPLASLPYWRHEAWASECLPERPLPWPLYEWRRRLRNRWMDLQSAVSTWTSR